MLVGKKVSLFLIFLFLCSFQCIQACDYDDTKLVTGENLVRHRTTKFAHLSLKHISLIGVVRMKVKGKKKKRPAQELCTRPTTLAASFFDDAAAVAPFEDEDDDDDDEDDEDGYDQHGEELDRGMSESEYDSDSEDDDDERPVETSGDLSEMLVAERENEVNPVDIVHDHTYSCNKRGVATLTTTSSTTGSSLRKKRKIATTSEWRKKSHYRYSFLYSMVSSGVTKKIRNCIPKAVAILSNSKTIILGHVNFLLECLDPRLAQLCYMDHGHRQLHFQLHPSFFGGQSAAGEKRKVDRGKHHCRRNRRKQLSRKAKIGGNL